MNNWIQFGSNPSDTKNVSFQLVLKPTVQNEQFQSNFMQSYITTKYVKTLRDTGCMVIMLEATTTGSPNGIFCLSRNTKSEQGKVISLCQSPGESDLFQVEWNPHEHPCIKLRMKKSFQADKPSGSKQVPFSVRVIQP
ncbi:hypothetical protein EBU95_05795 [bacterium]|nr:hypothetical protein [bacterium]